ncbi:MAG: type 4a pilus biogenesis protein PilO [Deltaproteobacteria bacterium]|nr:type 4a pilus biogenesis protein PilO [Deltaproteobacteria bacterium]
MKKKTIHNFLYYSEKFNKLDKKRKVYIYISFFTLVFSLYYHFFLSAALFRIQDINKNIVAAKLRLNDNLMMANRIYHFRKEKEQALKKLDSLLKALPDNNEISSLLADISEAGRDSGLEFILFQPEDEIKKDIVICLPITIRIKGAYFNLLDFLNKIASLPRLVNIDNITIEMIEDDALLINCKASTYRFINNG